MSSHVQRAQLGSYPSAPPGWSSEFQRVMRAIVSPVRRWSRQRNAVRALTSMSDAQLKDIGLHRSEILWAVRGRLLDR